MAQHEDGNIKSRTSSWWAKKRGSGHLLLAVGALLCRIRYVLLYQAGAVLLVPRALLAASPRPPHAPVSQT